MKTKSLLKKCAVVCILLIGIAETTNLNAQEFTVGALIYRINDQGSATVIRHVNGTGAAGGLSIPASVNYDGTNFMVTSIDSGCFYGCEGLTGIIIPNSITSIGDGAWEGCSGLSEIYVTNGNPIYDSRDSCNAIIKTADNELISGCKNTIIPNSVTSIGCYAFGGCSSLTSITIPNSVTSIGICAFEGCSGLTSITIPNYVTSIGGNAFSGCTSLTSITIPNYVTSIGPGTFSECSGLTSITIPNSVTSIGHEAFRGCTSLTSITIPNSVTSIKEGVFRGCSGLVEIYVTNGNPVYDSRNNCNAIIKTTDNELISGCKNTVIPNSVTSIGNGAFEECTSLISITIPNSVTSIGGNAFSGCSSLTGITIPNSVTSIEERVFRGCSGLVEIYVTNGNPVYDSRNNCNAIISVH